MLAQVIARDDDITRALDRKTMRASFSQRARHFSPAALGQQRPHCIHGGEPHARRCAGSKNAEDEFFPETIIRAMLPHFAKLSEPRLNFSLAQEVCSTYLFRTNGLMGSSHAIVNVQILGLLFFHCQRNSD